MFIERVRIRDYRNIAKEELEPSKGINLIFGTNAQGKTNFLDALHITAYLKSVRATRDREIIRNEADRARVEVGLVRNDGLKNSLVVTLAGGKKFVKLDGNPIVRFEDAIGVLSAHFFFPSDLSLIKGDPALRRETLDYEVVKAVPSSIRIYADFKRALLQRNAFLKSKGASALGGSEFKAWTDRMVAAGTEIAIMRSNLLERIKPRFSQHYSAISQTPDLVGIEYVSTIEETLVDKSRDSIRTLFVEKLKQSGDKETELGYTTVGPHRDELLFTLDNDSLRRFGSQGQQRSAVLALKISLCDVARELSGEDPVLCLDDALSELDDSRKKQLLNTLKGRSQVFITLASKKELNLISILASAVYEVKNGKLNKIS